MASWCSALQPFTQPRPKLVALKGRCINGHAFTPENTYRFSNKRRCKKCWFEYHRRWLMKYFGKQSVRGKRIRKAHG